MDSINVGGFVGSTSSPESFIKDYWDISKNPILSSSGEGVTNGVYGKTTAELQQQATFDSWEFGPIWTITAGEYPVLQWQNP